jgi:predicted Fe-Mo cluster-binding NifX family protein
MCSAVVSTRISKKTKETLREAGIDISAEVRKHLEDVADGVRARQSLERLNTIIKQTMPPAKKGYAARSVREDRERR